MIRYAKKEELEQVNKIRKQVAGVHAAGRADLFRDVFSEELKNVIVKSWEDPGSDIIVAVRDSEICGFANVEYIDRPISAYMQPRSYYHIVEFGVDERYRRQKVGTELFEFMRSEATEKGYGRLELDVFGFNEGAVKFYESMGFTPYRLYMECENHR